MMFTVDEHGFLRHPNLHDGYVDGIQRVGDAAAVVSLRDSQGQLFAMELAGVEGFVCDDFRLGNIIFGVQIVSRANPSKDTLASLYVPPRPKAAREFHDRHEEFLKQKSDRIKAGALTLVAIEPAYGCSLRALCKKVEIASNR